MALSVSSGISVIGGIVSSATYEAERHFQAVCVVLLYSSSPPLTFMFVVHVPDGKSAYETGVIWFRTRRTEDEEIESVSEIEADKIVKRRFLEAIGQEFDEDQLVFFAKPTS